MLGIKYPKKDTIMLSFNFERHQVMNINSEKDYCKVLQKLTKLIYREVKILYMSLIKMLILHTTWTPICIFQQDEKMYFQE